MQTKNHIKLNTPAADSPLDAIANLIDAMPVGVLMVGASGRTILVNDVLLKMFGHTRDALIGEPVEMLLPESLRDVHLSERNAYLADPHSRPMGEGKTLHARNSDGSLFPVEIGMTPVDSGDQVLIMATVVDVSHRQQLQNELLSLIDSAPMGIVVVDGDGQVDRINDRAAEMFGYTAGQLLGQPLELLLPQRHRAQHSGHRARYLAEPETRLMGSGRDLTGLHKDGTEFPVEVGLNVFVERGRRKVIASINDITERKHAEQALRRANADLDEFTYVASHDLKSPVRGIGSLLEWIEEDLGDSVLPAVKNNIERAKIRVERMQQLIDDLLTYSRAGRSSDIFEEIDLRALVDEVIDTVDPPNRFNVLVELKCERISTVKVPLATVLRNLLANAVKHHDRDAGTVRVRGYIEGTYLVFEVTDDGPGVPQAAQERIWKLFQTLSAEGSQPRSGIGLAVSKRLVQTHGGRLEVESHEGERGSTFRFTWMLVKRKDLHELDA